MLVFESHASLVVQELEAGLGEGGFLEAGGTEAVVAQTAGGHGNGVSGARVVLTVACTLTWCGAGVAQARWRGVALMVCGCTNVVVR